VYSAFGHYQGSYDLFEQARVNYEKNLCPDDDRLGGLYNNMGLTLVALERFGEAYRCFQKALDVMARQENGALEQAITYLNMASAAEAEHGPEKAEAKIEQYLELAEKLLNTPDIPRNGYYAFVCEKCAPTFDYYGWFACAAELNRKAREIYERS